VTGQRTASASGPMTGGNREAMDNDLLCKSCKEDDPTVPVMMLAPATAARAQSKFPWAEQQTRGTRICSSQQCEIAGQ